MHKKYSNPPIIEAICEFRFPPETSWATDVADKISKAIQNKFPNKESRYVQEIQFSPDPQNSKLMQHNVRTRHLTALLSEDRSKLIQIGAHLIAINKLKPYLGWEEFSLDIQKILNELKNVTKPTVFQKIGLRYINQIELPLEAKLEDFLTVKIKLNSSNFTVENNETSFLLKINDNDNCKIQFKNFFSANKQICAVDLDYFLQKSGAIKFDDALNWIFKAHEQVYEIFESCITDQCRNLFGDRI